MNAIEKQIFDAVDMFFPLCSGECNLTRDQRTALAKWIAQRIKPEVITWIDVDVELPDDEETVLCCSPQYARRIWLGSHDFASSSDWLNEDGTESPVPATHWAHFPEGPIHSQPLTQPKQ
jgi:hypothetical protein